MSNIYVVWFDHVGIESRILHPQRDLFLSIPDLLGNSHVSIDFATQITYYNIIFAGMIFYKEQDIEQGSYGREIYCQILSLVPQ